MLNKCIHEYPRDYYLYVNNDKNLKKHPLNPSTNLMTIVANENRISIVKFSILF